MNAVSLDVVCRFLEKVDRRGPDACWLWTASLDSRGYGQFRSAGRAIKAHRLAFAIANDVDPGCLHVCHHCDNPSCVNPRHLFLGTAKDNMRDMGAKGRGRQPRGTANGRARLTEADVIEVRAAYAAGGVSQYSLAAKYGISRGAVHAIVDRRSWKHISERVMS